MIAPNPCEPKVLTRGSGRRGTYLEEFGGGYLMERDRVVVEYIWSRVKIKFKLINLMNNSRIEGYNGK